MTATTKAPAARTQSGARGQLPLTITAITDHRLADPTPVLAAAA